MLDMMDNIIVLQQTSLKMVLIYFFI